jgi:hypothetical protein
MTAMPLIDGAAAIAVNFKRLERNSLRGFFDLALAAGVILRGCFLHEKNDRFWVGLPGKPYTAADGTQAWANIVDFRDKEHRDRFQEMATQAALAAYRRKGHAHEVAWRSSA